METTALGCRNLVNTGITKNCGAIRMAYRIDRYNGDTLTTVSDGAVDTNYTSLNLIGKNFAGYGALMNENFVFLLENFANAAEPTNPLTGQLWYDAGKKTMKVRTANDTWKNIGSATASPSAPTDPNVGDQWWDTTNEQLKTYSGTAWVLIGPLYNLREGVTGAIPDTLRDDFGVDHVVIKFYVNNVVTAIWSKDITSYTVDVLSKVVGFYVEGQNQIVKPGLTQADLGTINIDGYTNIPRNTIWGTVEDALRLEGVALNKLVRRDATGNAQSVADTLQLDNAQALVLGGSVTLLDNDRWSIGTSQYKLQSVYATTFHGVATSAQYADLAERFEADQAYEPGTVVALGGDKEITQVNTALSNDVFGVISTDPAYLMNSQAGTNLSHPAVASVGRVPVKVIGTVKKHDRLVSAGNGVARAILPGEAITSWNIIGRALASKEGDGVALVEAVVRISL